MENVIYQETPQLQTIHNIIMDFSPGTILATIEIFFDMWNCTVKSFRKLAYCESVVVLLFSSINSLICIFFV